MAPKKTEAVTEERTMQTEQLSALDTFVYMDETKKVLDVCMSTRKNLILYGKGGYGKSEFTLEYLKEKGIEPYTITMGTGMTTDRLFGGLDLPAFNASGKIEYLVENSFMNHEYVIFEELFDAPDFILEQLKDILSSKVFRNGSQVFPIKTKVIICCTNKTREEFAKNNSLKALMERFPLEHEVKWNIHNRITYENLLTTKLGFANPMLTFLLEHYAVGGSVISPRIAIVAAEIVEQCGPDCLAFIAEFNSKPDLLRTGISKFKSVIELDKLTGAANKLIAEFKTLTLKDLSSVQSGVSINKNLFSTITKLKSLKVEDSMAASTADNIKKFNNVYEANKKQLDLLVTLGEDAL